MGKHILGYCKRTDRLFWAMCLGSGLFACVVLASIGMVQLGGFSTDAETGVITGLGGYRKAAIQLLAMVIGVVAAIILSNIDYHNLAQLWPVHAAVTWGLVLPTLIVKNKTLFGLVTIGYNAGDTDNYSWYKVGPMTFQPTELAKISFILTFALHLDHVRDRVNEPKELLKLLAHLLIPCAIIHIQGDDGTMLIFLAIGLCMLFAAGLSWKYILGAAAAGATAVAVAFAFFSNKIGKSYQWLRILAVYDSQNNSGWALNNKVLEDYTYQQARGEISIGAGQIFGRGLFSGDYVYVPNVWNDFAFSWIANAVGFVGCFLVLGVLIAIVVRCFSTGLRSEDLLGTYTCVGIGAALLTQIVVNVGMNVRVLPVVGVTLPFYSAGGSSILMIFLSIGMVLSVYMHNKKTLFGNE